MCILVLAAARLTEGIGAEEMMLLRLAEAVGIIGSKPIVRAIRSSAICTVRKKMLVLALLREDSCLYPPPSMEVLSG
jgi:hypothetical protein